MKHQVIVADDSQTIQKVISITLTSEPFEITECLEIKKLNTTVSAVNPKIVLLDFNLSEDKTGYDLCKDIKSQSPNTLVVFLFGTFDTIDEDLINECGASNWIVKPFDGNKFINLCRNLVDHDPTQTFHDVNIDEVPSELKVEESEDWVMDVPSPVETEVKEAPEDHTSKNKFNVLETSMQDWGIEIPSVIGQASENISDIPEVISSDKVVNDEIPEEIKFENHVDESEVEEEMPEEGHFPESSDLEYPDIMEVEQKPTLELTSIDDLNLNVEEPSNVDNLYAQSEPETDVETLKEQIQDEQEDLWSLDSDDTEFEQDSFNESFDDSNNVHVLHDTPSDFPKDVMSEDDSSMNENLSDEIVADVVEELSKEVVEEVKEESPVIAKDNNSSLKAIDIDELIEKLRPMIEDVVRTECQKMAEKVSWEVIPDLAENLIKGELEKISDQVLNQ